MRTTLLAMIILTTQTLFGQLDEHFFTITAASGLSLREGPGLAFERLAAIPFNTQVRVDQDQINYDRRDTIGGVSGHWVPTRYQNKNGYLFSAYLKRGHLFKPAVGSLNRDYRIAIPGYKFDALNYDPDLHWYAIITGYEEEKEQIRLEEVKPNVAIGAAANDENYGYMDHADLVSIDLDLNEEYVLVFIGSKHPIDNVEDLPQLAHFSPIEDYMIWGRPVFPYEQLKFFQAANGDHYALGGRNLIRHNEKEETEDLVYQLDMLRNPYERQTPPAPHQTISEQLTVKDWDGHDHVPNEFFSHPRLCWEGDINGDGAPDLLFYRPNDSNCCGGSDGYFLLMSEENDGVWTWQTMAEDTIYYEGC